MKPGSIRHRFLLTAFLLTVMAFAPAAGDGPRTFTLHSGAQTFKSAEHRGRFIAMHFLLKTECPYCMRLVKDYVENGPHLADVVHIFIKPDSEDEITMWSRKASAAGIDAVIYRDPDAKLAREFGIPGGYAFHNDSMHYPALILLDGNGREVFRHVGADNSDRMTFDTFALRVVPLLRSADIAQFNLAADSLALRGYDPVSYFSGAPQPGRAECTSRFRGAVYRFASEENRRNFAKNPEKYAPQYGGWCATAMADGGRKVEIDPTNYKVTNGRLFLFYRGWLGDALREWNKDEADLTRRADSQWEKLAPTEKPHAR